MISQEVINQFLKDIHGEDGKTVLLIFFDYLEDNGISVKRKRKVRNVGDNDWINKRYGSNYGYCYGYCEYGIYGYYRFGFLNSHAFGCGDHNSGNGYGYFGLNSSNI